MTIEHAAARTVEKPWGRLDLEPWSATVAQGPDGRIGEIWFERADPAAASPALLMKLLFTQERLSVQVHPGDEFARSMGEARGKSEAWYVMSAERDGCVALGLDRRMTADELRSAIADGSIGDRVAWRGVRRGDVIDVPAGVIHAIGAGLVIAEIQQRSDTTFRLFDYGRDRDLHVEQAVAVADAGPASTDPVPRPLGPGRTLLLATPHFVLEKIHLPARALWSVRAVAETWLLVLHGHARVALANAFAGEALFLQGERTVMRAGASGCTALVAYAASSPDEGLFHPAPQAATRRTGAVPTPAPVLPTTPQRSLPPKPEVRT
jgi:mannose-6-phosphate isomerase